MENSISSTVISQKLPSSETDNFYATMFVTPDKKEVVAQNKESTWNYENNNPDWYSKFVASNDGKSARTINTRLGPKEMDFDDTVDQWGDKFADYMKKNDLLYARVGAEGDTGSDYISVYEDSFTRNLFLNNGVSMLSTDQEVAHGISLALKNSKNIDDAMLSWLGGNSTYLSALKDDRVRTYVKKQWQENFDSIQNLTTSNDMPIQMSVLQALTEIVRAAPTFTQREDGQSFEGGA